MHLFRFILHKPYVGGYKIVMWCVTPSEQGWTSDRQGITPNENQKERGSTTIHPDAGVRKGQADAMRWVGVFLDDEFPSQHGQSGWIRFLHIKHHFIKTPFNTRIPIDANLSWILSWRRQCIILCRKASRNQTLPSSMSSSCQTQKRNHFILKQLKF